MNGISEQKITRKSKRGFSRREFELVVQNAADDKEKDYAQGKAAMMVGKSALEMDVSKSCRATRMDHAGLPKGQSGGNASHGSPLDLLLVKLSLHSLDPLGSQR